MITREQFLAHKEMKVVEVNIPEWDDTIKIKAWNTTERAEFEVSIRGGDESDRRSDMRERAIVSSVIDEKTGKLMFTKADIGQLGMITASVAERILIAVTTLNHITSKDQEEIVKNSEEASS